MFKKIMMTCMVVMVVAASSSVFALELMNKVRWVKVYKSTPTATSNRIFFQLADKTSSFVIKKGTGEWVTDAEVSRAMTLLSTAVNGGQTIWVGYSGAKDGTFFTVDYLGVYQLGIE